MLCYLFLQVSANLKLQEKSLVRRKMVRLTSHFLFCLEKINHHYIPIMCVSVCVCSGPGDPGVPGSAGLCSHQDMSPVRGSNEEAGHRSGACQ